MQTWGVLGEPWDVVDEASYESFPASDPPGWGSSHAAAIAEVEVAPPERRARRTTRSDGRRIALAIALGSVFLWLIVQLRRRTIARR